MRTGSNLMRSNSLPVAAGADGRQQLEQEQLQMQSWDNVRLILNMFFFWCVFLVAAVFFVAFLCCCVGFGL